MKFDSFLVTGGAGFVGSHLVDSLVKQGAEKVVVLDNFFLGSMKNLEWALDHGNVIVYREDARYLTAMQNILDKEKPEAVFNLAAKPLPYSFIDPEGAYMLSVEIAQNLAQTLRRGMYKKLLHFSSSEAYGTAVHIPINEAHPLNPITPYGAGKVAADLLLLSEHNLFDLEVSIIRPFNMIGPRQNIGAYAAVVPVTIRRILSGEKPLIEGDGFQTRDFSYVGNVAEAALKLLECDGAVGRVVNVGSGRETSVREVIQTICLELHYPLLLIEKDVEWKPERLGDVRRQLAGISLAKELIGYEPKTSLEEGIRLTVEWFKKD